MDLDTPEEEVVKEVQQFRTGQQPMDGLRWEGPGQDHQLRTSVILGERTQLWLVVQPQLWS